MKKTEGAYDCETFIRVALDIFNGILGESVQSKCTLHYDALLARYCLNFEHVCSHEDYLQHKMRTTLLLSEKVLNDWYDCNGLVVIMNAWIHQVREHAKDAAESLLACNWFSPEDV